MRPSASGETPGAGDPLNEAASYVTGSHSLKIGYQGNHWIDDREVHTNSQRLQYTFTGMSPNNITLTQYASPWVVRGAARQDSFYVQDQWTIDRLTLQGALRYDRPWSWFPEQVEPQSRFFPGATFPRTDGVSGYHDITPRLGAAYDVFGTGKTALKINLGKYLQGASVSNLASNTNPSIRIRGGGGGIFPPSITRTWNDADGDFTPDCVLTNFEANGECLRATDVLFGSTDLIGSQFDPDLLEGWGKRPSDWTPGNITVNLLAPGQMYGPRVRQWDLAAKKIIRVGDQRLTVGLDMYNLTNSNVTLGFSGTFSPTARGWMAPTSYMNPRVFRLNAEYAW